MSKQKGEQLSKHAEGRSAGHLAAITRRPSMLFGGLFALALFLALGVLVQARLADPTDRSLMTLVAATRPLAATDALNWAFRLGYAPLDGALAGLAALVVLARTRSLRLALLPLSLVLVVGTQAITRLAVVRSGPQTSYALPRSYSEHSAVGGLDQTDAAVRGAFVAATGAGDENGQGNGTFPSGHAARLATLATLGALALGRARRFWLAARIAAIIALGTAALLVGYSTLFFGYHWPSDLLGGYMLGGGITLLAWKLLFQPPSDQSSRGKPALAQSMGGAAVPSDRPLGDGAPR